jgi:Protein of unknown function (DUF992)
MPDPKGMAAMLPASRARQQAPHALLAALALAAIAATPARAANVEVGVLTCKVAGGVGFVFGSTKDLDCVLEGISGGKDRYVGSIDKYGLDLGFTGSSYIVWTVLAPSTDIPSGALTGNYGGVSAETTVGLGVGANALLGGSENSIALQPVSVQAQQGLNVAVGVSALSLRFDGHY